MAIKFQVNEDEKKLQQEENALAEKEGRKAKKVKLKRAKQPPMQKWSNLLLVLSVIGVIYSATYIVSGLLTLVPTLVLWFAWFIVVLVATVLTLGGVWISEGWRKFNSNFLAFNTGVGNASVAVTEFMYKIFPYLSVFFGLCIAGLIIVSSMGLKKHQNEQKSFKNKLIVSIIFAVVYLVAMVFDIVAYLGM